MLLTKILRKDIERDTPLSRAVKIRPMLVSGFTILELLIVVSIVAILSVALVVVLNPAETLKQSRDANRISDLSTMKKAIALYMTSTSTPVLGPNFVDTFDNNRCLEIIGEYTGGPRIYYSLSSVTPITDTTLGIFINTPPPVNQVETPSLTNGAGWIPVNFDSLTGGSPISNLPVDPTNRIVDLSNVASTDLVYRYACSNNPLAFEMNAQLESDGFTSGTNNKRTSDGGNNSNLYEVGTNLKILGASIDF